MQKACRRGSTASSSGFGAWATVAWEDIWSAWSGHPGTEWGQRRAPASEPLSLLHSRGARYGFSSSPLSLTTNTVHSVLPQAPRLGVRQWGCGASAASLWLPGPGGFRLPASGLPEETGREHRLTAAGRTPRSGAWRWELSLVRGKSGTTLQPVALTEHVPRPPANLNLRERSLSSAFSPAASCQAG